MIAERKNRTPVNMINSMYGVFGFMEVEGICEVGSHFPLL